MWAVLVFFGRSHVDRLREALQPKQRDDAAQAEQQIGNDRRQLLDAETEAGGRYIEGQRLAEHRGHLEVQGRRQPEWSPKQEEVLQKWDRGQLQEEYNQAISALGDRSLLPDSRDSTGHRFKRTVASWNPPDWRETS